MKLNNNTEIQNMKDIDSLSTLDNEEMRMIAMVMMTKINMSSEGPTPIT